MCPPRGDPRLLPGGLEGPPRRRGLPVRVVLEEALQRPRRPQDPRPLHHGRRHHRLDQLPQAAALPVHLAEDPGHRRRAHPAVLRPCHPPVPGDLLSGRPCPRPTALRRRHRPVPGLIQPQRPAVTARQCPFAAGDTLLTGTPTPAAPYEEPLSARLGRGQGEDVAMNSALVARSSWRLNSTLVVSHSGSRPANSYWSSTATTCHYCRAHGRQCRPVTAGSPASSTWRRHRP